MRGPLNAIRRRRAERTANEADAPSGSEATGQVAAAADGDAPPTDATTAAPAPGASPTAAGQSQESQPPPAAEGMPAGQEPEPGRPSFRHRGRMRRRLRYLRRVRELGFRDLGGLAFEQHKHSQVREDLVQAKLAALSAVDSELRALEHALDDRRPITELREPGISACPRCGALHGSDASFCPSCGVPLRGPRAVAGIGEGLSTAVGEIGPIAPVPPPSQLTLLTPGRRPGEEHAPPPSELPPAVEKPPAEAAASAAPPAPGTEQPTEIVRPDDTQILRPDDTQIVRPEDQQAANGTTTVHRPAEERSEP
jgi:hypothetical protein